MAKQMALCRNRATNMPQETSWRSQIRPGGDPGGTGAPEWPRGEIVPLREKIMPFPGKM